MKINFFIIQILITIGLSYGQILMSNENNGEQQQVEDWAQPFMKPLSTFGPPMEPIFPKFPEVFHNKNSFQSHFLNQKFPFDWIHETLNRMHKMPKIIKNQSPFSRWPPSQVMPFFSSVSVISKSEDNPFLPLKTISQLNDDMSKERHDSGLPVFHPKIGSLSESQNLSPIISSIVNGMKPMITDIQIEQNQENNSSSDDNSPQLGQLSVSLGWNIQHNFHDNYTDVISNYSSGVDSTEPSITPLKQIMNSVFDSFSKFKTLLKHSFSHDSDHNFTETSLQFLNTDKTPMSFVKTVMVECDCPEDKHKDNCLMAQHHKTNSLKAGAQVIASTEESPKTGPKEVMKKLTDSEKQLKVSNDMASETITALKDLEESELKVEEKDMKYYWYDYVLVGSIGGTSLMLCLLGIILFIKRCSYGKQVKDNKSDVKVEIDIHNENNEKIDKQNQKIESLVINM